MNVFDRDPKIGSDRDIAFEQSQPWLFEPAPIDPIEIESHQTLNQLRNMLGRAATFKKQHFPGNAELEREDETNEDFYAPWSVLLQTEKGPIHFKGYPRGRGSELEVVFPRIIQPSDELISDVLEAEPDELRAYSKQDGYDEARVGFFRFPEPDDSGQYHWVDRRDTTPIHYNNDADLDLRAVLNGVLGTVRSWNIHTISLESGHIGYGFKDSGYVGQKPAEISSEAVVKYQERFKKLAIAIANYAGGATQLSAPLYGEHRFTKPLPDNSKAILTKLASQGFRVAEYERTPKDGLVDAGLKVITGTKVIQGGTETVVAGEGYSSFWYTRGQRAWNSTRGIVLDHSATTEDINLLLPKYK